MTIFDDEPSDWSDLQDRVAQLFEEIGCEVSVGQPISLVRGAKEIDVAVLDPATSPPSRYLCECKFWSRAVPQEVIHSFRTVVADSGAHRGFVISRAGFQAGAKLAAEKTNLELLTFSELQAIFFDRWRVSMGKKYLPYADRLFPYWDYPGKMPVIQWQQEHVDRQQLLIEAYRPLLQIGPWFEMTGSVWNLPITVPTVDSRGERCGTATLRSYRELYDFIDRNKDVAVEHFKTLFGEHDA